MENNESRGPRRPLAKPIPERIKEAREARGFTIDHFAELLDVSRQSVAQYETGQTTPGGDVMSRIIASTAQPPAFFVTNPQRSGNAITPFWRSLKRMELHHRKRITRRLEWAGDIAAFLDKFIHLPAVNVPAPQQEWMDRDDDDFVELVADAVRVQWRLGRGPIRDLLPHMEKNGITLVCEPVGCEDMDAVSTWQRGRPFILFSEEVKSGPRCAFNLAHELGHIVLHAGVEVTEKNLARIERQANRFAGAFLMPRETFGSELLGTSIGYLRSLKSRWGVAIAAMAYRAKDLGVYNANQHGYVMKQLNAAGVRKVEWMDDQFQQPKPSVLAVGLRMLIENGVQTKEQIETALALNMADVETLCGVDPGYLDSRVVKFQPKQRI